MKPDAAAFESFKAMSHTILNLLQVGACESGMIELVHQLKDTGLEVHSVHAESLDQFRAVCAHLDRDWVVVTASADLADLKSLVEASAEALGEVSVIVASDCGEDQALRLMDAGAHDVVARASKRLPRIVAREFQDLRHRRACREAEATLGHTILDLKRAEDALLSSEERWKFALEGAEDCVWDWNVPTGAITFSARWGELLGYDEEELGTGIDAWSRHIHPDDLPGTLLGLREHLEGRALAFSSEHRAQCKDGAWKWILSRGIVTSRDAFGNALRMIGTYADITERKGTEAALVESERGLLLFRTLVQHSNDAIFVIDSRTSRIVDGNVKAHASLGYTRAELLALNVPDVEVTIKMEDWQSHVDAVRAGGSLVLQGAHKRKDGSTFPAEINVTYFVQDAEHYMIAVARNITERQQAAAALKLSYELLSKVSQQVPGVIYQFRLHPDGRTSFPYASVGIREIYELNPEDVREDASAVFAVLHPEDKDAISASIQESAQKLEPWRFEYRVILPRQGLRWRLGYSRPERLEDGSILWHGFITDITAQKEMEEQLRQAHKMEVVGRLAGGVAHDFNNILTVLMLNLDRLQSEQDLPEPAQAVVAQLAEASERAASLTHQLMLFSRKQAMKSAPLDINEALANLLKLLERLLGANIQMKQIQGAPNLWVDADAGMIDQAILNLCINARDAMPHGGALTLVTSAVECDHLPNHLATESKPGSYVRIDVIDTGCGMEKEVIKHLFEPFFTTKEVGKGTGLGLASVHGIVHQHKGWIQVESVPGQGTTFRIYLPRITVPVAPVVPITPPISQQNWSETILLVEDEDPVRLVMTKLISRFGYRVLAAADGLEALELWSTHASEIDMLLTDMVMPEGLSGLDLAEILHGQKPNLKVIITSGYSAQTINSGYSLHPAFTFLAKPCDARTLATTIRECLDSNPMYDL